MMVYIQWATATPGDWTGVDVRSTRDVTQMPRKMPALTPTQSVDDQPGWVNAINCQGIVMHGYDWYAIEPLPGDGVRLYGWQDYPIGERWATVWDLLTLAPDPNIGGRMNTRQTRRCYAEGAPAGLLKTHDWSHFIAPSDTLRWPGKWLLDGLYQEHIHRLTIRGWSEWIK